MRHSAPLASTFCFSRPILNAPLARSQFGPRKTERWTNPFIFNLRAISPWSARITDLTVHTFSRRVLCLVISGRAATSAQHLKHLVFFHDHSEQVFHSTHALPRGSVFAIAHAFVTALSYSTVSPRMLERSRHLVALIVS